MARPPLPQQGSSPPWGNDLNAHILALGVDIDGKASQSALNSTNTVVASKASQADLNTTNVAVTENQSGIAILQGDVSTLGTAVGALDTRVTTLENAPPPSGGGGGGGGDGYGAWFSGKKWYALGTSITAENSYTAGIQTLSGMSLVNRGVGGASLSTASNGNIWTQLTTNVQTDAEVITIETINDFRLNVPLGTVADAESPSTSYYSALKAAANWILTNRPAARCFWFTAYGDAMNAGYPNGKTTNSHGKYYWEYNDAMRAVGKIYGIPVINVGEESGINYYTCQYYTTDMIHMNAKGGTRYGEYVWAKIRAMGWETTRPIAPGAAGPIAVTGVSINQGSAYSLAPTQTVQLSGTITPGNATNKSIAWSTNAASVATVSADGLVTGVTAGSATITATTVDGSFTDTIAITVANAAVASVAVSPTSWNGAVGNTQQLTATVSPTNATNKTVSWSSSDPTKATVSAGGLVTAVANGTTTITCTTQDGGKTATCAVTVSVVAVTGVDVTPNTSNVAIAGTVQLTANVIPSNAANKTVSWGSSNGGVASVDSSGLVTGQAVGSATITATTADGGFTDSSAITVIGAEWDLSTVTSFPYGFALTGLYAKNPGEPDWTGVVGTYGGVVLNNIDAGHNAVEYEITNTPGQGQWVMVGCNTGAGKWGALGDLQAGSPWYGGVLNNAGSILLATGANFVQVPSGYPKSANTRYRMARIGNVVRAWYYTTGTSSWTKFWEADVSTWPKIVDDPTCIAQSGLGVICGGGYTKVINVKSGTWTPP